MAGRVKRVVKPARCAHPQWQRFGVSRGQGGYYRCVDCGEFRTGRHLEAVRSGKLSEKVADSLSSLSQPGLFGEGGSNV